MRGLEWEKISKVCPNRKFEIIPGLLRHREDEMNDKGWLEANERPVSIVERPDASIDFSLPVFAAHPELRDEPGGTE